MSKYGKIKFIFVWFLVFVNILLDFKYFQNQTKVKKLQN